MNLKQLNRAASRCEQGRCPFDASKASKDCCEAVRRCQEDGQCEQNHGVFRAGVDADCVHTRFCKVWRQCAALRGECIGLTRKCRGSRLQRLICYLDEPQYRRSVILELGQMRKAARPAVKALCKRINEYPSEVFDALLAIGGRPAMTAIVRGLRSRTGSVRVAAIGRLAQTENRRYLRAIVRALSDKEARVRKAAINALSRFDPPAKMAARVLIAALRDPAALVRVAASSSDMLQHAGPQIVPQMIASLTDTDPDVRARLCRAFTSRSLASMSAASPKTIAALKRRLTDHVEKVGFAAAITLAMFRVADKKALAALIAGVKHASAHRRVTAIRHLSFLGARAKRALPALIRALRDADDSVRMTTCSAFSAIGATPAVVDALSRALDDSSNRVRVRAARTLGTFGAKAKSAVKALIKMANKRSDLEARFVFIALARIGKAAATARPLLEKAIAQKREKLLVPAAVALGRMGDRKLALRVLSAQAASAKWKERYEVAAHLAELKDNGPEVIALLMKLSRDSEWQTGMVAASALHENGAKKPAIAAFKRLCTHAEPMARINAAGNLDRLGERQFALRVLIRALRDEATAWHAAIAIGQMGRDAKRALPALRRVTRRPGAARGQAMQAIANITFGRKNQRSKASVIRP